MATAPQTGERPPAMAGLAPAPGDDPAADVSPADGVAFRIGAVFFLLLWALLVLDFARGILSR